MKDRLAALDRYVGNPVETEDDAAEEFPEELMNVPGFVNAWKDYIYATAARPNKVLSFAGAIAMMSHLAGRKFIGASKTTPNLYLIALAESSFGKDAPRQANKLLADQFDALDTVAEQIGSGQGLEDALFVTPSMLFQMDEFDTLLNALKDNSSISEHIYGYLLTFFGEASTSHALRKKVLSNAEKQSIATSSAKRPSLTIRNPTLTLFATAIPNRFYSSLTLRALDNGLLARCLVFEATKRGALNRDRNPSNVPIPQIVLDYARELFARSERQRASEKPEMRLVPYGEGAAETFKRINDESDKLYDRSLKNDDAAGKGVWGRAVQIAERLALVYAVSENLYNPVISSAALEWGWKVVSRSCKRMLAMAENYVSDGRVDDNANKIIRYLKKKENRKRAIVRSELSKNTHLDKKAMDEAIETLRDRDLIEEISGRNGAKIYRAKMTKKRGA